MIVIVTPGEAEAQAAVQAETVKQVAEAHAKRTNRPVPIQSIIVAIDADVAALRGLSSLVLRPLHELLSSNAGWHGQYSRSAPRQHVVAATTEMGRISRHSCGLPANAQDCRALIDSRGYCRL